MSRSSILLLSFLAVGAHALDEEWAKTAEYKGDTYITTLHFYFHDVQSGNTPSAVAVAHAPNSTAYKSGFGTLFMADDKLTVGPDPNSKLVGRAQGMYGYASQEELVLIMSMSYSFTQGKYNGSSISIVGRNPVTHPEREIPVVGGTGVFRMGMGYALARTHWVDFKTGDAIVGYNVTVFHY